MVEDTVAIPMEAIHKTEVIPTIKRIKSKTQIPLELMVNPLDTMG